MISGDQLTIQYPPLRQYLRAATPDTGVDILQDAFTGLEEGARQLLRLCLGLRANPKTRKKPEEVAREWRRTRRMAYADRARWYNRLVNTLMAMFRTFRTYAFPMLPRNVEHGLQDTLPRRARRLLGYVGAVKVNVPTMRQAAESARRELWDQLKDRDAVLWCDNWYLQRYSTNPDAPVLSQDVTAMAVLLLREGPGAAPAARTRSRDIPVFPGHLTLDDMASAIVPGPVPFLASSPPFLFYCSGLCA